MLTAVGVHDWVSALSAAAFAAGVAGALVARLLPAVKGARDRLSSRAWASPEFPLSEGFYGLGFGAAAAGVARFKGEVFAEHFTLGGCHGLGEVHQYCRGVPAGVEDLTQGA